MQYPEQQKKTAEEIENYYLPFMQSGYLTMDEKLELLLFEEERQSTSSLRQELYQRCKADGKITGQRVEEFYRHIKQEDGMLFSGEEKKAMFERILFRRMSFGILGLLCQMGGEEVLLGACCPEYMEYDMPVRIAVKREETWYQFAFPEYEEEEMIRDIRYFLSQERKGELTRNRPKLCFETENGWSVSAVRPPAEDGWGIALRRRTYGGNSRGSGI